MYRSAREHLLALESREISSWEMTSIYLTEIERRADRNAVVTLDGDRALAAAAQADRQRAAGKSAGMLLGLPVTIKDALETAGLRTTCGSADLAEHTPDADADAVARLRAAGAIVLGKTNTAPMCQDIQTSNTLFGTTLNPHDPSRTAGGSSGGSACAVAAGLSPLDVGSDLAGSLRLPAHYCGVFGLRTSRGIVPARGHIPRAPGWITTSDMLALGPIARSAADLDLALLVLAGPSAQDGAAWRLELPGPIHRELSAYRVGVWADDSYRPVDSATSAVLHEVVRVLREAGADLDETTRPVGMAESDRLFQALMFAGSTANTAADAFAAEVAAAELLAPADSTPGAAFQRARTMRHRDWLLANEDRQRLRARWAAYFADVDVLITPAAPTAAVPDQSQLAAHERFITVDGTRREYWEQTGWLTLASVVCLPAVTVPVGRTADGLPLGVQLIGPHLADRTIIHLAGLLAAAMPAVG
ncbi:amidase [Frankia sp. R82]|uniref:amidase n=1 Tax=Frankia sp. R82 TaxID=2950553 RepID=UPI0020438DBC|nr:amidase [Frankia sp. R82]MCM3882286.1 amidase [Frankia sp. R82]